MSTTIKTCPICEQQYEVRLAELKRGWGQTCSRSCNGKLQRQKEKKNPECSLLPRSGVTDDQVREAIANSPNLRAAAKRLGVSEGNLRSVAAQHGIKGNKKKPRPTCVSPEDIIALAREGFTRPDTAYLLGISPAYLKDLIKKWDLARHFTVSGGRAAAVAMRGYAWDGFNLAA